MNTIVKALYYLILGIDYSRFDLGVSKVCLIAFSEISGMEATLESKYGKEKLKHKLLEMLLN